MLHDQDIEMAHKFVVEGEAHGLAELLLTMRGGLRHLERGDYVRVPKVTSYPLSQQAALDRVPRPSIWVPAIEARNVEVVQALLDGGVSPARPDAHGAMPLRVAGAAGATEIAKILLLHGADVNPDPVPGVSPLHVARLIEMVDVLVDAGANIDALTRPIHQWVA